MVVKGNSTVFDPAQVRFRKEGEVLWMENDGRRVQLAAPRRALPLSSPDEWIMLASSEGEELGSIRRLNELEPASRDALRVALEEAYRITTILRVLEVEREPLSGQISWRVVIEDREDEVEGTQAGQDVVFHLSGAEDIQTARYPHIYFADINGNRWEIPNCEALDLTSRRVSDKYF